MNRFNKQLSISLHHQLLLGTFFSEVTESEDYISTKTNVPNDLIWEYFLPLSHDAKPSHSQNLYTDDTTCVPEGYELEFTDTWMRYSLENTPTPQPNLIFSTVESNAEMKLFVDAFQQAYSGHSEADPYGKIPEEYKNTLLSSFQLGTTQLTFHYCVSEEDEISALFALGVSGEYGFIYCIGVIPKYRNRGLSKLMMDFIKHYSKSKGCNFLALQTEKDSFVEKLYENLGFERYDLISFYKHC